MACYCFKSFYVVDNCIAVAMSNYIITVSVYQLLLEGNYCYVFVLNQWSIIVCTYTSLTTMLFRKVMHMLVLEGYMPSIL